VPGGETTTWTARPGRRRLPLDVDLARRLLADGRSISAVARLLGVSRRTLSRRVAQAGNAPERGCGVLPTVLDSSAADAAGNLSPFPRRTEDGPNG